MSISNIVEKWKVDEIRYKELGELITTFIKSTITEYEILPEISFRIKELHSIIKKIQKKRKEGKGDYNYNNLTDKLGVRIICVFQEEMELIDIFIRKYFNVTKADIKKDHLDIKSLDYLSNHYDVRITSSIINNKRLTELENLDFEIQVRTLNQHAWANTAHFLSYKNDSYLPPNLERKIYRLLSLYEIADDEFSNVNSELIKHPDNQIYHILKVLERKFYKYAKVDYNKNISIETISLLINYCDESSVEINLKNIEGFIEENTNRIHNVFDNYRDRFYEFPFITQPEIFLIWYCLDNCPYTIEDYWEDDFDPDDLNKIKMLWGKRF